jgi:hypothetical protein
MNTMCNQAGGWDPRKLAAPSQGTSRARVSCANLSRLRAKEGSLEHDARPAHVCGLNTKSSETITLAQSHAQSLAASTAAVNPNPSTHDMTTATAEALDSSHTRVLTRRSAFGVLACSGSALLQWSSGSVDAAHAAEEVATTKEVADKGITTAAVPNSAEFYMKWRYAQPSDILPYIYASAKQGDADAILKAMDEFGTYYPM